MSVLMPTCPECKENAYVEASRYPKNGNRFCTSCMIFFTPAEETFRLEFEKRFPTLSFNFISKMNEIGNYGVEKYKNEAIASRIKAGDYSRGERTKRTEIVKHVGVHLVEYVDGVRHDHFGTPEHQLAAAAFNVMMEFQLSEKNGG